MLLIKVMWNRPRGAPQHRSAKPATMRGCTRNDPGAIVHLLRPRLGNAAHPAPADSRNSLAVQAVGNGWRRCRRFDCSLERSPRPVPVVLHGRPGGVFRRRIAKEKDEFRYPGPARSPHQSRGRFGLRHRHRSPDAGDPAGAGRSRPDGLGQHRQRQDRLVHPARAAAHPRRPRRQHQAAREGHRLRPAHPRAHADARARDAGRQGGRPPTAAMCRACAWPPSSAACRTRRRSRRCAARWTS